MLKNSIIVTFLLLLVACKPLTDRGNNMNEFLKTKDGLKISFNFTSTNNDKGIVLLHMLGKDKTSWSELIPKLKNYNVISIDFRGHGKSEGLWGNFNDVDFNKMVFDIEASINFLKGKGIKKIIVIGASIGANTALNYALSDESVKGVVLLSPGLNYRGVKIENSMSLLKIPALIIASEEDSYSFDSSKKLSELNKLVATFWTYKNLGHGTNMFINEELMNKIVGWIDKLIK